MEELLRTFLISCVPALATGLFAYFTAQKNANSKIEALQKQNEHEINKLMEQHKIDIDAFKEKHHLEIDSKKIEHQHKLELLEREHKYELARKENELESTAKYGAMGDLLANPEKAHDLLVLLDHPSLKKRKK